jgi:hypothetical protein
MSASSIATSGTSIGAAGVRRPSSLRCALVITTVKLSLHLIGLRRTLRAIHRLAPPVSATREADYESVEQVARRVAMIAAFFPARVACLEQSLTLYWLLLRARVPATFRIGVLPSQFAAHAWVEFDGQPVLESELVRTVIPFRSLPL